MVAAALAVSVILLSSQRARAAFGRRGPPPFLGTIVATARRRERFARESCCSLVVALHNRLELLESARGEGRKSSVHRTDRTTRPAHCVGRLNSLTNRKQCC